MTASFHPARTAALKCEKLRMRLTRARHLRCAGRMLTVTEHFDLSSLDRLRDLWRDLWWKTPNASFLQSFEAFDGLWTRAAKAERPRVFVVSVSGRPIGLAPWIEKSVGSRLGRLQVLTDGSRSGPSARPAGNESAVNDRGGHAARRSRLPLGPDRADGTSRSAAAKTRDEVGASIRPSRWARSRSRASWSSAAETGFAICARCRRNLRENYKIRNDVLEASGRLECLRYRPEGTALHDDDPRWDLFGEIAQAELELGGEFERLDLLHDLHKTAASIAGIDLNLLRIEGKLVAWSYNYRCDGRIEVQRLRAAGEFATAAETVLWAACSAMVFAAATTVSLRSTERAARRPAGETGRANSYLRVQYPRQGARLVRPWPARLLARRFYALDRHRPFWRACFAALLLRAFVQVLSREVRRGFTGESQHSFLHRDFADEFVVLPLDGAGKLIVRPLERRQKHLAIFVIPLLFRGFSGDFFHPRFEPDHEFAEGHLLPRRLGGLSRLLDGRLERV